MACYGGNGMRYHGMARAAPANAMVVHGKATVAHGNAMTMPWHATEKQKKRRSFLSCTMPYEHG